MKMFKFLGVSILILMSVEVVAQNGIIRGTVIEDNNGEPLYGVTVVIKGTTNGAITDFDGKFQINATPGTYDVQASFVSFQTVTISKLEVSENEVTLIDQIRLREDVEMLEEVVVTAEVVKTTEAAILTVKRKSANLLDGISAANFRKIGDSDAASAAKRITGVSIEGGKYVYVRGLGDRYTKTLLNGVDIPGLDPDRNSLQMDIFPTNVIDNIIVLKSFTADMPADFTGGIVNIETKDFPDEPTLKVSTSFGLNPSMHFNSDYLSYEGGGKDWLGYDDGTRDIPTGESVDIPQFADVVGNPDGSQGQQYRQILESFNPNLAAIRQNSFMDYSLGASYGDQRQVGNNALGFNIALSYKNSTEYYEDAIYGRYGLSGDPSVTEMEVREYQTGDYGTNNVLIGGLAGVAYKRDKSKVRATLLHLQNGESNAGIFDYENSDQGANFNAFQHNLDYSQRSLTNLLVAGEHVNSDGSWKFEWKASPTKSNIEDPDIRFTRYRVDAGNITIGTESGFPERIWRFLEEENLVGLAGATRQYKFKGREAKVKFGFGHTYKARDYKIQNFALNVRNIPLTGDPNELFLEDNLWPYQGNASRGTTFETPFIPDNPNQYDARIDNSSAYISNEFEPLDKLKAVIGVRAEKYVQRYTGQDQLGVNVLDNEKVLDILDFFPTANLIYQLKEKQNLRFSYSKTIARPSFKELSYAEIYDPITGRTFIGGLFRDADDVAGVEYWDGNLKETDINNFDLRWEMFQNGGQTISVSAFYKSFNNPIEIVQFATQTGSFQSRNVGDGRVIGGEFEFRQNLAFVSSTLENFTLNGNVSITDSQIKMSATELQSRINNAREGQTISDTRNMAGQAPYLVNVGLSYDGLANGFDAGLFYNVQGETLQYVGIVDRPDVYSVPFHSLNFTASKVFGTNERMRLSFKVSNILNDDREEIFKNFNASDQIFTSRSPRTTFGFGFSYSIL